MLPCLELADAGQVLLEELKRHCPDYTTLLHTASTIVAPDASLDMVFHWSVFTRLYPGESYLYTRDAFRALSRRENDLFIP